MALSDLVRRGPRNIRNRLFRDIILIILITVTAILIIAFFQGVFIKDYISGQLISETGLVVRKRFTSYLTPFDTSLRILSRMESSPFPINATAASTNHFIRPILDVHRDVEQVTLLYGSGLFREFARLDDNDLQSSEGSWSENDPALAAIFTGGLAAKEPDPVYWSETFTSKDAASGLRAGIQLDTNESDTKAILAYFIPAEKIIAFIADIEIDKDIDIVMFNDRGLFLSKWNPDHYRGSPPGQGSNATPALPTEKDILSLWQNSNDEERVAQKFSMGRTTWWTGFTPLSDDVGRTWIGVIIPESAFIENVYQQWLKLGALVAAILLAATLLTINLVRKYSFQLKDLPQKNLHDSTLLESVTKLIDGGESSTLEFKSTMRHNLQSQKHGKEIEIAWLKTVSAFMNSDGGILLIGVNDDGEILGIVADAFANEDKCRLHFKNLINSHIGTDFARYIHLKFCSFADKYICVVECERVRRPVFLSIGKQEDFYIRSGPSSMKLSMSQMVTYLAER